MIINGLVAAAVSIGNMNAPATMGGPIAISYSTIIALIFMGIGLLLLHTGCVISGTGSAKLYLLLALISLIWVFTNLWNYPSNDGAYYLLRYGRAFADSLMPPTAWEHVMAFSSTGFIIYFGLTQTFQNAFSYRAPTRQNHLIYILILFLIAAILIAGLGLLCIFFTDSLNTGAITASEQQFNMLLCFLVPATLILLSCFFRKYDRIALVLVLLSSFILILLGVTLGAQI